MVNQDSSQLIPLLMTASVSTRGMKGACFSDEQREQMYLETLRYYLETLPEDQPIVFADNSGWGLDRFQQLADQFEKKERGVRGQELGVRKEEGQWNDENSTVHLHLFSPPSSRVEFISVDPAICDQTRGKGYNEILLMNAVVERSELIKQAGAFMKVTGRYPIYNLPRFLKGAREWMAKGGKFYGDMKDHKVFDWIFKDTAKWNGHAAYTVLFATTVDFYREKLAESYRECNDYTNQWIEVVWYRILAPFRYQKNNTHHCPPPPLLSTSLGNGVKLRLPVEPVCGGFQGSAQQTVMASQSNESMKAKVARFVGNCIRTFTPWFWF